MNEKLMKEIRGYRKIINSGVVPENIRKAYTEEKGSELTVEKAEAELKAKFAELAPVSKNGVCKNIDLVFEIITETLDEKLPTYLAPFDKIVETRTFSDNEKAEFVMPKGKTRLMRIIQRVALGVPFKRANLDKLRKTMEMYVIGGGVRIEYEKYLTSPETYTEMCNALLDGIQRAIDGEVAEALNTLIEGNAFKKEHEQVDNVFSVTGMQGLVAYAMKYSPSTPVIVGTTQFASKIRPVDGFVSDTDKNEMRNQGYIGKFCGADVFIIENGYYEDGTPIFPENIGLVMPNGNRPEDKFIKLGLEGNTRIRELKENDDWSIVYEVYRKMGIIVGDVAGIGLYKIKA